MAGFFDRLKTIFGAKADAALDALEDPRQTLDYSYQRQLQLLQEVRKGVAEVATSRKRVELQLDQLNAQIAKYDAAARQALGVNREDLAREALLRKAGLQQQVTDMQAQHAQLQGEEEKLIRANQQLQARVDAFRTKKETIKATYSAAQAQAKIGDAYAGLGKEMGDIGLAIQRAEDKTQQLQARAGAVDELLASGALGDPLASGGDDITRELDALASAGAVDDELAALKRSLGQLEPGAPTSPTPQLPAGEWQQPRNLPAELPAATPEADKAAGL